MTNWQPFQDIVKPELNLGKIPRLRLKPWVLPAVAAAAVVVRERVR